MTAQNGDPRVDVPEADLLDQQTPAGPPLDTERDTPAEAQSPLGLDAESADLVDRLEQLRAVSSDDDEDYPHQD